MTDPKIKAVIIDPSTVKGGITGFDAAPDIQSRLPDDDSEGDGDDKDEEK